MHSERLIQNLFKIKKPILHFKGEKQESHWFMKYLRVFTKELAFYNPAKHIRYKYIIPTQILKED